MLDVIVKIEGEINLNSDTRSQISTHGGGAGANTASWLATLEIESHFFGCIGEDAAGIVFLDELRKLGVHSHVSKKAEFSTGTVVVLVEGNGNRTMFPDSGANSRLDASLLPDPKDFAAVLISGYSLFNTANSAEVIKMVMQIKSLGIPIFFDPASVGTMKDFGKSAAFELLKLFDLICLNEEEAFYLTDSNDRRVALAGLLAEVPTVAIKLGKDGAIASTRDGNALTLPAAAVEVVDTTGAGDAFNAGFLASWSRSEDLGSALQSAIKCASSCVAIIGARPRVGA